MPSTFFKVIEIIDRSEEMLGYFDECPDPHDILAGCYDCESGMRHEVHIIECDHADDELPLDDWNAMDEIYKQSIQTNVKVWRQ
jgi:hypothetical protein